MGRRDRKHGGKRDRRDRKDSQAGQGDRRGRFGEERSGGRRGGGGRRTRDRSQREKLPAGVNPPAILKALKKTPGIGAAQIAHELNLPGPASKAVARLLRELKDEHKIIEPRPGKYMVAGEDGEFPALIDEEDGKLVALIDDKPFAIDPKHTLGAQAGDQCLVMKDSQGSVLVTRVNERVGRGMPGTLNFARGKLTFIPDVRRQGEFQVANPDHEIVQNYVAGQRVVGRLERNAYGEAVMAVERLLDEGTPEVADFEHARLVFDLPGEFPEAALKEAEDADGSFALEEREDLREKFIFTIDPETAKDFDDAISVEQLPNGHFELGVHIADVSHFVRPGTALDDEATLRGTSIYLINRVIPMLPELLSNGLCSLVPNENRYALSVFIELDRDWKVQGVRPAETLICSQHRLSYEEALAIIEKREDKDRWPEQLVQTVRTCHFIAQNLRKQRIKTGAINIYSVERSFVLDADGQPIDVQQASGDVAHELIEEFMLLANRCIASWLDERGSPAVYRIHGEPDEDKLEFFAETLVRYGLKGFDPFTRPGLQGCLDKLADEPEAARLVLNFLLLRCFQKAIYDINNVGHYALSFSHYLHFTSPIRRYPDLICHRLVKYELGLSRYRKVETRLGHLDALARQCTYLEQRAEQAERLIKSLKAARYLSTRLGDTFAGVVVGVSAHGLFVQLREVGLDGMVPVRELDDDYYEYDEGRMALVGSSSGRVLSIGLECDVIVSAVDIPSGEVTLALPK